MRLDLHPRRATLGALAAAALLGVATVPAHATQALVTPRTVHAVTYLTGGVSKEEEAYMHKVAKDWPLRLIFSERKDNEFVADVNLTVTNQHGAKVLMLKDTGPMTYAMVPAGKYRVSATFHGITESREVTLDGKQGQDVYFHWKGKTKIDPWDGKPLGGKQVPG